MPALTTAIEGDEEPKKPSMKILDVNVVGALYTLKLARYHFLRNDEGPGRDRCFVIFSSAAGYQDVPGGPIYMASKYAARALMCCMRRTTIVDGIRANALAPW
jgi:NAD(P)-dependent dehydrogenase (short-subunit alcohol dehydrogenase family)